MKIQDILFIVTFLFVFLKKEPRVAVIFGLLSTIISIPLFSMWKFFTAERLTWYAAAFFLLASCLYSIYFNKKDKRE